MKRGVPALFLALSVIALLLLAQRQHGARADEPTVQVAIDTDVTGNAANSLGTTEACNATPYQVGDTFDVDVVVRGVPAYVPGSSGPHGVPASGGIVGAEFNLLFDPAVLQVNIVQATDGPSILAPTGGAVPFDYIDYNGASAEVTQPPGTNGDVGIAIARLGGTDSPGGEGVITRITLQAVGDGVSRLDLVDELTRDSHPLIFDSSANSYAVEASSAAIAVGQSSCAETPGPRPTATYSPFTPGPTPPGRYLISLVPSNVPANADSIVEVHLSIPSSRPVATFGVSLSLGADTDLVSCSTEYVCEHNGLNINLNKVTTRALAGDAVLGKVTVHPTSATGTALSLGAVQLYDANLRDAAPVLDVANYFVIIGNGTQPPTSTPTPPPPSRTPTRTPTTTSSRTPAATFTPTPTPTLTLGPTSTSTPTPASLPEAGGPGGDGSAGPWAIAVMGGVLALGGGFVLSRRRSGLVRRL